MEALRAEGLGFDRIARALNEAGVKPRRGAKWHSWAMNKILTAKRRGSMKKALMLPG